MRLQPVPATTLLAYLPAVLGALVLNLSAEYVVARFYTRRKVAADTRAAIAAERATLLADIKAELAVLRDDLVKQPMRGGVDPHALNDAKAAKAQARVEAAVLAEVEMKTFLADRLGPRGYEVAHNILGEETLAKVVATGERWRNTLAPFLSRLPSRSAQPNGTDAARSEPATGFAME